MGVYPSFAKGGSPEMRVWCVYRLEYGSVAGGGKNDDLGRDGRLLGIAPEALSVSGKGAYTMADLQAVDEAMQGLEGTLHPDVLKPFADLRKKL